MDLMQEFKEQLGDHEDRIKSLEATRTDTLKALADLDTKHEHRLREVKQGLEKQIDRMERDAKDRDDASAKRQDRIESKMDGVHAKLDNTLKEVRKSTPPWVGPLIGILIAAAGWAVEIAIYHH